MSVDGVTLRDLDEHYSIEDVYIILEVSGVNAHNSRIVNAPKEV